MVRLFCFGICTGPENCRNCESPRQTRRHADCDQRPEPESATKLPRFQSQSTPGFKDTYNALLAPTPGSDVSQQFTSRICEMCSARIEASTLSTAGGSPCRFRTVATLLPAPTLERASKIGVWLAMKRTRRPFTHTLSTGSVRHRSRSCSIDGRSLRRASSASLIGLLLAAICDASST
jgi:hypothetical protein